MLAAWGVVAGAAPHVLHHVGPIAGAAVVTGASGKLLFAAVGFVAMIPFLLRLYRRFETWKAPTAALAVFAAMFTFSTFVIGPIVRGEGTERPRNGHTFDPSHHGTTTAP